MALTNAEKQARYRERALRDPDGLLLTRVQVLIGPHAAANLKRIRKRMGWTVREAIEHGIGLADQDTLASGGSRVTSAKPKQRKKRS